MIKKSGLTLFMLAIFISVTHTSFADTKTDTDQIKALLDRECVNLKNDKLYDLLQARFSSDIEKGPSPEILKIMEGVIKRTDFDNIPEEKTVEIIGLVSESFKKGAPLEYLDQIFDVAYVNSINVDQLTAAAKALKEFYHSDVPQDVYEEFVYHSLENGWDPAALPVLTRGLIYGVERGLTPQKVALAIMIDMKNGELKKKTADQLVLDAIKLVREKEPKNWKPMKEVEKDIAAKLEEKKDLERLQKEAEDRKRLKEFEKQKAEEEIRHLRAGEENRARRAEQEKLAKDMETRIRAYQSEILKYQKEQADLGSAIEKQVDEMKREREQKDREREANRRKQLDVVDRNITAYGQREVLNVERLYASVERFIGIPYRYGGDSESGLDCSAFTRRIYRDQGVELPRSAREQSLVGVTENGSLQPGDLVFFDPSIMGTISHVGVYLGSDVFAHASSSKGVVKSSLKEKYYLKRFVKANRIFVQ